MARTLADVRQRLQLSKLDGQKELLSDDIDLSEIAFITKKLPVMRFEEAVLAAEINRTIEGASTVKFTVADHDNIISRSGRLASEVDIKIDGLWFRLVKVQKRDWVLTLTFESREVSILRTYDKKRLAGWGKMSRVRFAQILVNEVREMRIPFVSPDPKKLKRERTKQERAKERHQGFGFHHEPGQRPDDPGSTGLTIKGEAATNEQLHNIEKVLDVGASKLVKRKLLVVSVMVVIQESTAYNLLGGDRDSVGMFQQRASMGWPATRDITKDAEAFFNSAIKYDIAHPKAEYWQVAQGVQRSAFPKAYQQWKNEAEALVTAYGIAGGDISHSSDVASANLMGDWETEAGIDDFQFMRGRPKTLPGGKKGWQNENSWDCLQRLAEEVQWRCFEVSGSIYFVPEPWLFMSAPRARISGLSGGVDKINFDYDVGKKNATVTVKARLSRWEAPPGTTIEIFNEGNINGRWLVTEISRSLFDSSTTVTLKKPRPRLPEPKKEDLTGLWDNQLQEPGKAYVPTPGFTPDLPGGMPSGKALRDAVLNNPSIDFTRVSQRNDIQFGLINNKVLLFMLHFVEAGFPITVTALRSDHSTLTSGGKVSKHSSGLAIDMGNYGLGNPSTRTAMMWIDERQVQLQWQQVIGPIDSLVRPLGIYDALTLKQHDDHIHVGF